MNIGFAMCGSFCTYEAAFAAIEKLRPEFDEAYPIMSEKSFSTDSRFGKAEDFVKRIENICGRKLLREVAEIEAIGPKRLLDIICVVPCTGNTLGKLASGIADSTVTFACKSQLRNQRPVVLAVATNDGLLGSAANIGTLLARKNFYFVPFGQDDPVNKPSSLIADFSMLPETVNAALKGVQLQPIIKEY